MEEGLVTVGPRYPGPGFHPLSWARGNRALQEKGRDKTGESTGLGWGVPGPFPPHSHQSHRKQG